MKGWKCLVATAVVLAGVSVPSTSAGYFEDGCKEMICKTTGPDVRYPNPRDKCSFCCCYDDDLLNRPGLYFPCPDPYTQFDAYADTCVPSTVCPATEPRTCNDIKCHGGMYGWRFPDPSNECGFCCCFHNGTHAQSRGCPYGQAFDPPTGTCQDSDECPPQCHGIHCPACYAGMPYPVSNEDDRCGFCLCAADGSIRPGKCPPGHVFDPDNHDCKECDDCCGGHPGPGPTTTPGVDVDGCENVTCPDDPEGVLLQANPDNPRSFCQCDWGGRVHEMPCSPGTKFSYKEQTCI